MRFEIDRVFIEEAHGVAQLMARAQVNAEPVVEYPLRVQGDARRVEGSFELDLAALNVKVGDAVWVSVTATDKAGQTGTSEVRHVLISPRSIDIATHQRLAELAQAADYARDWSEQLAKAQRAVEQAKRSDDHSTRNGRSLSAPKSNCRSWAISVSSSTSRTWMGLSAPVAV